MEETTPELNLPVLNKRALNMYSKGPNQTTRHEQTEQPSANPEKSPSKKKKPLSKASVLESANLLNATAAGTSRDVSILFSEFAEVMSDRAAADTAQIKQLDDILREAQNLESFLKEKKEHLRQTLSLLSDKLKD